MRGLKFIVIFLMFYRLGLKIILLDLMLVLKLKLPGFQHAIRMSYLNALISVKNGHLNALELLFMLDLI